MSSTYLYNDDGDELVDLADLEPWKYSVEGLPITRLTYTHNSITIEWATREQLDQMRSWFL